jgi:hypothetical protein
MLREAFGEYSLSRTEVSEWHSRFKAGRLPIEDGKRPGRPSTSKTIEKTIAEQSLSSQTPLGSVMEFATGS